jgi:hypothetical protein
MDLRMGWSRNIDFRDLIDSKEGKWRFLKFAKV